MNLENELNKLNIQITYSLKNLSWNEYYIIINKDDIRFKYIVVSSNMDELCSYISILLINKVPLSIIEERFNLIKTNDIMFSITKPKLIYPIKLYKIPKYSYFPKDGYDLYKLARKLIDIRGSECSLNDVDTSKITNMSSIFKDSKFKGDISMWNLSNVDNMIYMFENSNFNQDISNWEVSNVCVMNDMFKGSLLEDKEPHWYKEN